MARWRAWRLSREIARHPIPERLWLEVLNRYPFIGQRPPADLTRLRPLCSLFLSRKEFSGAQGLEVTDLMALCIAAQACLPILELGIEQYDGFIGIVVHPDEVLAAREQMDDDGVLHTWDEVLAGEAMAGGPVMLSWSDVKPSDGASFDDMPYNVVIHEFAHVLDMRAGQADGMPALPNAAARAQWLAVMEPEFNRFCELVEADQPTWLDPYGAEAPEEFFAVASEAFFVNPGALAMEHPALYALLSGFYKQDPEAAFSRAAAPD
jgi:Mlc titration factor MtfA (ptsG expression regulator)